MHLEAEIRRLKRERGCGLADVVKCVAIWLAVVGQTSAQLTLIARTGAFFANPD